MLEEIQQAQQEHNIGELDSDQEDYGDGYGEDYGEEENYGDEPDEYGEWDEDDDGGRYV